MAKTKVVAQSSLIGSMWTVFGLSAAGTAGAVVVLGLRNTYRKIMAQRNRG